MKKVLLADDSHVFVNLAKNILEDNNYKVCAGVNKQIIYDLLAKEEFDIFLLDLKFPHSSIGMELLDYCLKNYVDMPVVMISGTANIDEAIAAIRKGAVDFIEKPFSTERLLVTIHNVIQQNEIRKQMESVQQQAINMVGSSPRMQALYKEIMQTSQSEFPVLIKGETGVGKELVARAIHNLSKRNKHRFIDFNCSAVPESLWESELFGHEKGSFTGAIESKMGYLGLADKGSIFLDEIGSMPLTMQPKLLRLLENGVIQKVGSEIQKVDVRVIAVANNDLEEQVKKGQFRQDLLFRLNVLQITVPPLRDHKEDIPELAKHFLRQDCAKEGLEYKELSAEAMSLLLNSNWQGNIRELKNVIDRCIVQTANSTIIKEADIKRAFQGKAIIKEKTLKGATAEFEKEFLINNLLINNWNVAQTADKIGIDRSNLHKKIKHYDIKVRKD